MVAKKDVVNNISGVGIIFPKSDPSKIFFEMKDAGYPRKAFAMKGLCIGGNWIGKNALADANPKETFLREINEEFCLDKATASTVELTALFGDKAVSRQVIKKDIPVTEDDVAQLDDIKDVIAEVAWAFGDFRQHVPRIVFDRADSENKAGDYEGLVSVWLVPLPDDIWNLLNELQRKFGNLSNESITVSTSLDEILKTGMQVAWGQDHILKQFFVSQNNYPQAKDFPLIPNISVDYVGAPMFDYKYYLENYEVQKKPG